jgi:hypothetical protein
MFENKNKSSSCPSGYVWDGKTCVKNWTAREKTNKPSVVKSDVEDLMSYGKKTLSNKKPIGKPIKNIVVDRKDFIKPKDSLAENVVEFFDPTGIASWDDASRAKKAWDKSGSALPSFTQAMDMFGAVPALGKLGKLKYLSSAASGLKKSAYGFFPWQKVVNASDSGQDVNQDNFKNSLNNATNRNTMKSKTLKVKK